MSGDSSRRCAIAFLSWRDTGHPDGGGSEEYIEHVAERLAARGHDVTIRCAAYDGPGATRSDAACASCGVVGG